MSINFRQPKYVLPLVALPFLCLFFFVYHSHAAKNKKEVRQVAGINSTVGEVSPEIKKRSLEDKLNAYRDKYKDADGATAVMPITAETSANPAYNNNYNEKQKRTLDSINQAMKQHFSGAYPKKGMSEQDREMADALDNLSRRQQQTQAYPHDAAQTKPKDPMELFKQQLAYMDSIRATNDPALKAEKQKKEALAKAAAEKAAEPVLEVRKAAGTAADFNTVIPGKDRDFIQVVIDENMTGYAGSRIRLRLLDDMQAGRYLIPKGTYLYALITGFSGQRVTLAVKSILYQDKILPVKLDVYDLDGLPGMYVPQSAFRDFTKDASTSVMQGVDVQSSSNSFLVSTAGQLFQSTSSAIADAIRKNKAKLKYNSYLYLIDKDALEKAQKNY